MDGTHSEQRSRSEQRERNRSQIDSGFNCLAVLLRVRGVAADIGQIRARCGRSAVDLRQIRACAKSFRLATQIRRTTWRGLADADLPAIGCLRDGTFLILARHDGCVVSVLHANGYEEKLPPDKLKEIWAGRIVLLTQPERVIDQVGKLCVLARRVNLLVKRHLGAFVSGLAGRLVHRVTRFEGEPLAQTDASGQTLGGDSGLLALLALLRLHNVNTSPQQIIHYCGTRRIGVVEMLRCAKEFGLKAAARRTVWERLAKTPLPGIASLNNGGFMLLGQVAGDKILVQRPPSPRPAAMTREDFEALWDGHLVLMTRRASLGELAGRFDVAWFFSAVNKYRGLFGEVLAASVFLQLFALISPLFFQLVIDKVLVHQSMTTLDVLVVGLIGVSSFEACLGGLRTYVFSHTTNRIDVELGARLYRHLLALPIAYFNARRVGDSVARVRELENIRQFLTGSALTLIVDLAFTVIFIAVMFYYSTLLTLAALAGIPLYVAISLGLTPLFQRRIDEKFRRGAENQAFLVESITGIETLKSMAVEPQMQRRWEEQLAAYVTASFRVTSIGNVASQAVQWINKLVTAGILYFGAMLVIKGRLTVGELVAFNMLASRVSSPVLRLAQIWQDFHQARLSIERLGDILNTMPEPQFASARAVLPPIRGRVRFEQVTFRYRVDEADVLQNINFTIEPGEMIGIVGSSGSGKSTIAKLIQRLYVPESGRIRIDDADLSMVDLVWLRRQIGAVPQDSVLFNRTIRENIALSDGTLPLKQIIDAAQLAGAHDFIMELPEGYETPIGERGSRLSGGQRQRIAIARALVTNPRILIFDEATSALDYESERAIQQRMNEIATGRTVIVIAHRLSTVRAADRIITLDKGRMIEDGSHDELLERNGRYAKLHYLQAEPHGAR
ncbi:MAG TPA: type I secretion system permease/ATPase [Xanthobacteraceae bacterium]|nr:type I secretion system permease/ATPase [Xanthobacteraceae bacterium]